MSEQTEFDVCRKKADQAIDLAVAELVKTRGGHVVKLGDELTSLLRTLYHTKLSRKQIRVSVKEYEDSENTYTFEETRRMVRVGKVRSVDLMITGHFSSETSERFVVIDLQGELSDQETRSYYVRFEAWCRLYYLPERKEWFVHYVDIIIRHKSPAERTLFMFEHEKSGQLVRATEKDLDELCLFFKNGPQGGMWG